MKLTVLTSNLKQALENVGFATISSGTLPILSYILLEAKKSGLEITSTNLEIGIKSNIRAKVDKIGKAVVPFKVIYDFIVNNLDDKVNFELDKNNLKISTSHFRAEILTVNPDEFPILPKLEKEEEIVLKKVIFASSSDSVRPILSGILFWLKKNQLLLVGTDSFRLAEQKIKQEKNYKEIKNVLPQKAAQIAMRILSKSMSESFSISFSENQLKFKLDENEIVGRLIEGEYPDYKQIIPQGFETRFELNKEEFSRTLKILSSFSQETNKEIKIEAHKNKLKISAHSPQIGSNEAEIDAQVEGKSNSIKFNSIYLLEGLNVIEEENVVFDLTGPVSPGVIKGKDNDSFTYIVMPLREE